MEMWEIFGSRSEYLKAPKSLTFKVQLILSKRHELENEQTEKDAKERKELQEQIDALNAQGRG